MSIISAAITLLLVMDPIGNSIVFASILDPVAPARRFRVVLRELLIALGILLLFLAGGHGILRFIDVDELALSVSGGIILFLIALRIIFPPKEGIWSSGDTCAEPLLVPLATPLLAGPSAIATILLMSGREPGRLRDWFLAVLLAWGIVATVLLVSTKVSRRIDRRLAAGGQKLTGMILVMISVQMLLTAFGQFLKASH